MRHIGKSTNVQRGMTLVEALVALVVLSIGLLGVAALQVASLRNSHAAHTRAQATALAYDIADRMRANRAAAQSGNYDIALGATIGTPGTLAEVDLLTWKDALTATLPAGDGAIAQLGNLMRITIQWDDSRGAEAPIVFVTETQL
jgi:type IV pilus assembly protein PilV